MSQQWPQSLPKSNHTFVALVDAGIQGHCPLVSSGEAANSSRDKFSFRLRKLKESQKGPSKHGSKYSQVFEFGLKISNLRSESDEDLRGCFEALVAFSSSLHKTKFSISIISATTLFGASLVNAIVCKRSKRASKVNRYVSIKFSLAKDECSFKEQFLVAAKLPTLVVFPSKNKQISLKLLEHFSKNPQKSP